MPLRAEADAASRRIEIYQADGESLQSSLKQVQVTIDTADFPTAHTKAKVIHEKSQAVSREIEAAFAKTGKGKTLSNEEEVR